MKNKLRIRQSLLLTAIILGVLSFLIVILQGLNVNRGPIWTSAIIGMLLVAFNAYFLINKLIQRNIDEKINRIYKIIQDTKVKRTTGAEHFDVDESFDRLDIDVRNWLQKTERQVAKLKVQESFRREFMGDVSHELKTPIFNIQGFIHALLDGGMGREEIRKDYLNRALKNVDRLAHIVADLDIISSLDSGEVKLEFSRFDIGELVLEVFDELKLLSQGKHIKLSIKKTSGSTENIVLADRSRIHQVLVNLISNSIKYGKEGGSTQVGFYEMGEDLLIEVGDNGIGIDKEHIPNLFNRFFRVDKSRSRDVGGSGLGLSIVKHIIEAHSQAIHVRSTPGIGSTFGFTLKKVG